MKAKFSIGSLLVYLIVAGHLQAEEENVPEQRAMMGPVTSKAAPQFPSPPEIKDFEWSALTAGGPASGANPRVGESGKPYYDFADGRKEPILISREAQGKEQK